MLAPLGFFLALLPAFARTNNFSHPGQVTVPDQNRSALVEEVQAAVAKTSHPDINSLCLVGARNEFGLHIKLGRFAVGPATIRIHRYPRRFTARRTFPLTPWPVCTDKYDIGLPVWQWIIAATRLSIHPMGAGISHSDEQPGRVVDLLTLLGERPGELMAMAREILAGD